jgi:hypothetical protein
LTASVKRLVVDDVRVPSFKATVVRSSVEALELLRTEHWDEVWLDHDMDLAPETTPDVSWLTRQLELDAVELGTFANVDMFVLHSANSSGRKKMRGHLDQFYLVLEMEDYPDKGLSLTGGGVVEMFTDKGRWEQKYPVAGAARSGV